jgi:adenylosuccinate synthase
MKIVLGAGFGDEGKGRVVDALCSRSRILPGVIRFSGGHQAAHRVVVGKKEHIFAHFGSGSLRGSPTYWSHYCPVAPVHLMNELVALEQIDVEPPAMHIDGKCAVTTPYDVLWGRCEQDIMKKHGSCGMGIYATWKRERDGCHFLFEDILHPEIVRTKLKQVRAYYRGDVDGEKVEQFIEDCALIANYIRDSALHLAYGLHDFETHHHLERGEWPERDLTSLDPDDNDPFPLIFEGSQGLLLDQSYGFFPHVTPSNTGTQNVAEMLGPAYREKIIPEIWLVTRAYSTRHGHGPFLPEAFEDGMYEINNPHEKNSDEGPQGKFRTGPLSLDLLRYAVKKDAHLRQFGVNNIVITGMDLMRGRRPLVISQGALCECRDNQDFYEDIKAATGAQKVWVTTSPNGEIPLIQEL